MIKTMAMLATVLLFTACASTPPAPAPTQPLIFATAEDKAKVAEWDRMVAAETGDRAREAINHSLAPDALERSSVMRGEKGVLSEEEMGWPRAQVRWGIDAIQRAKTWPEPAAYGALKATGPIMIDGKGTDADWARATPIPIRYRASQTNVIDRSAATCRLLWDARNLYLFFDVPDTNIVSVCTNRDEAVSQGDCVEFFVLPSRRFGQYWEFNISPTGVVYDSLYSKYWHQWGSYERSGENAALTVTTVVDGTVNREGDWDRGYTVEVALPWDELPGFQHGAVTGDTLWLLLGWADKATLATPGMNYYANIPILSWFHNIWGYSRLTLE